MKGYFTMPYAYVKDRNISDDFWPIKKEETGERAGRNNRGGRRGAGLVAHSFKNVSKT